MTRATATLATAATSSPGGGAGTRIATLRSGWPLMLRATLPLPSVAVAGWAGHRAGATTVHLAAGGAGPIGGDRWCLDVRVGAGSSLVLADVAPTLLLPGPRGAPSRLDIRLHVGAGATLVWQPELTIVADGCRHTTDVQVTLGPGARLALREELLFGRHGEQPGTCLQRVRISTVEGPLYHQELCCGPTAPGWHGPAVTAGHPATGTVLIVDPELGSGTAAGPVPSGLPGPASDTAAMALSGSAVLFSTMAPDTSTLRRRLDCALLALLGHVPPAAGGDRPVVPAGGNRPTTTGGRARPSSVIG